MAASKAEQEMGEIVAAGGNLEPGYVFDARTGSVRKMDAADVKAADDAVKAEADAAKRRAAILEKAKAVVANDPAVAP